MKRLLLLLLFMPFLFGAAGDVATVNGKAVANISTVSGVAGASIATVCGKPYTDGDASCADTSCTGFILCQNFQTADTGWDNSETWTTSGTVNPVDTSPALRGTQSCSLADSSTIIHALGSEMTEVYAFARYRFEDASPSGSTVTPTALTTIFRLLDTSADAGVVSILTTGKMYCNHGTITNTSTTALDIDTTYYIWFHWVYDSTDSPNNGVITATVSTTTDPADANADLGCSVTTGNNTHVHADYVKYQNTAAGGITVNIDQILVKSTAIGEVCE